MIFALGDVKKAIDHFIRSIRTRGARQHQLQCLALIVWKVIHQLVQVFLQGIKFFAVNLNWFFVIHVFILSHVV